MQIFIANPIHFLCLMMATAYILSFVHSLMKYALLGNCFSYALNIFSENGNEKQSVVLKAKKKVLLKNVEHNNGSLQEKMNRHGKVTTYH